MDSIWYVEETVSLQRDLQQPILLSSPVILTQQAGMSNVALLSTQKKKSLLACILVAMPLETKWC